MDINDQIVITGAGGFIGGHLVASFLSQGFKNIRAIDIKPLASWYQQFEAVKNIQADLRDRSACEEACKNADQVFNLAADMGGMGFIEMHKADCMLSVLINTNLLCAAHKFSVKKFFFSSSACIYPANKQLQSEVTALKEADAYPAMPEDGYGWEKLFSERMCRHFREDMGLKTYVGRYHNVYGPVGTYKGGREKAPAALCRKIIEAKLSGHNEIEIWGDGEQTRSFMYIDDCIYGTRALVENDIQEPLNIGSSELVTINKLVDSIEVIAGVRVKRRYKLDAPLGVRGRNSDNTKIRSLLNWEPSIPLMTGLEKTYCWIYDSLKQGKSTRAPLLCVGT